MSKPRFEVTIYGRFKTSSDPVGILVDISHRFAARRAAERFARAISYYLPAPVDGLADMWVLVYALRTTAASPSLQPAACYLSFDPNGRLNKHHDIPAGYFGCKTVARRNPYAECAS
jgi:hypothetical protein